MIPDPVEVAALLASRVAEREAQLHEAMQHVQRWTPELHAMPGGAGFLVELRVILTRHRED